MPHTLTCWSSGSAVRRRRRRRCYQRSRRVRGEPSVTAVTAVDGARADAFQTRECRPKAVQTHGARTGRVRLLFFFVLSFACRRPGDPQRCCRPRACTRLLFFVVCFAPHSCSAARSSVTKHEFSYLPRRIDRRPDFPRFYKTGAENDEKHTREGRAEPDEAGRVWGATLSSKKTCFFLHVDPTFMKLFFSRPRNSNVTKLCVGPKLPGSRIKPYTSVMPVANSEIEWRAKNRKTALYSSHLPICKHFIR